MNCLKCGTLNPENAVFCKTCGASLFAQAQKSAENNTFQQDAQPQQQEAPAFQQENVQERSYALVNPVFALIKKWTSSSLFLTATILFTVCIGLSVLSGFFDSFYLFAADDGASMGVSLFSGSIISIIAMIGLWLVYSCGKGADGIKKTGFSVLKVISIINLVVAVIACGLGGIACIIVGVLMPQMIETLGNEWQEFVQEAQSIFASEGLTVEGFDFNMLFSPDFLSAFMITLGVILLIALAISAIFYGKASKNISKVINMIETGTVKEDISMGFIVFMFILGGFSVLSFSWGSMCEGVAYILFGIVLLKFRDEAEQLKYVVDYSNNL